MLKVFPYPFRSVLGIFAILSSITASALLIHRGILEGNEWHVLAFIIYGISLVALWTVSTLYHSLNISKSFNRTLEQLDHAMIYFLIAGTYTPICLIVLHGSWRWSIFVINWTLAVAGIVLKLVFRNPKEWLITVFFMFYIIMGWLIIVAWSPLKRAMPYEGLLWLLWGGIFYTAGAGIFNLRHLKIHPRFNAHDIWHIFVLAGSSCHFWMMYRYVVYLK